MITSPWADNKARRAQPLTKAAVQATGDTLASAWRDNQKNARLAAEWAERRENLARLWSFFDDQPSSVKEAYRGRLRSKGPSRVACSNPFRASEAELWRTAGHPECGAEMAPDDRIRQAVAWLSFLGSGGAFRDAMMNDLRGERAQDFRRLLKEVSHASAGRETRTQDVTLIAPVEGQLDRLMIVRVAPEDDGQKLYLIAYSSTPFKTELLRMIRDEWGTGSRLRCNLRSDYRVRAPARSYYRIYALKDREDGFVIVRKWTRGTLRREYYQLILSANPC
ncbi:MAG: hypothetical protein AAFV29_20355, partial [Myxococcota bacterium]